MEKPICEIWALNRGGKPQEIRNAIYRGKIVEALRELNELPEWQIILGLSRFDKNQKDVELILRLFSLFENWENYQKPMLSFLNKNMKDNADFSSERATRFLKKFKEVVKLISSTLDKPFRPKGAINSSVLDAVMVALLEGDALSAENLQSRYGALMSDEKFLSSALARGTTEQNILMERIRRAKEVLFNATAQA